MIAYNRAAEFLRARGYNFIYFGNSYDRGRWDIHIKDSADDYFNYFIESSTPWISEFQKILWNTTMLKPFYYHLVGGDYGEANRRQVMFPLEHLKTLPLAEAPSLLSHIYFARTWILCLVQKVSMSQTQIGEIGKTNSFIYGNISSSPQR